MSIRALCHQRETERKPSKGTDKVTPKHPGASVQLTPDVKPGSLPP